MILKIHITACLILLTITNPTQAFMYSKIKCESNSWLSITKGKKVVQKYSQLSFSKNEANIIILLSNNKKKKLVKIYPWAEIDFKVKNGIKILEKNKKNSSFVKLKFKDKNGEIYQIFCQKT